MQYVMNGIVLKQSRSFAYRADPEYPNYLIKEGTMCYELKSSDGRYSVVGDSKFVSELETREAA